MGDTRGNRMRAWLPDGLRKRGLDERGVLGFAYIVLDERVGGMASVSVEPWPRLDSRGRLRFPDRHLGGQVALTEQVLRSELYHGLARRAPRIGDVFAARVVPLAWQSIRGDVDIWEHPLADLVDDPVFDITRDARLAVKTAYYASLVAPIPVTMAEHRGQLDKAERVRDAAPRRPKTGKAAKTSQAAKRGKAAGPGKAGKS